MSKLPPMPTASDKYDLETGFQTLLDMQQELQIAAYELDPAALLGNERIQFILWNAFALTDELHEAMSEVGWKPWATSKHIRTQQFAGEIVDLLHFLANMCLAAGVTGEMLAEGYIAKRRKNAERQEEGYDGVTGKCPHCKRDYGETECHPPTMDSSAYCMDWSNQ